MKSNSGLHADGQKDYIKELKNSQEYNIGELEKSKIPNEKKKSLIRSLKDYYKKLIKETDESLFVHNVVSKVKT